MFARRNHPLVLEATELVGPLILTPSSVWACYVLSPQRWMFLQPEKRQQLLNLNANRWAALAGRAVKLRVSPLPYAAGQWAQQLSDLTPAPLPDVTGAVDYDTYLADPGAAPLGFNGWLVGQQRRVRQSRLDTKLVVLQVRVGSRPRRLNVDRLAVALMEPGSAAGKYADLVRQITAISDAVSRPGFDARPAEPGEIEWLFHRSAAPGVPAPSRLALAGDRWETEELAAFTDTVSWSHQPFDRTVEIRAIRSGREYVRHAVVLTVGRISDLSYPEAGLSPWLTYGDRMSFPVEWSVAGQVRSGRDMEKEADFHRNRNVHIAGHYAEHHEEPPPSTGRAIAQSREIVDEVTEGTPEVAARFQGVIRAVVTGETVEEAVSNATALTDMFADSIRLALEHTVARAHALAELIPAQKWRPTGFHQTMGTRMLAASLPHTSAQIGDGQGPYIGYAEGTSRHALMVDSNYPPQVKGRSGLCPIIADPGAGKSFLTGVLAYHEVRRGTQTVILDPSGPLARLCQIPELAPFAVHRSLTEGKPGSLSPAALIAAPNREDFPPDASGEEMYLAEVARVRQARKEVVIDTLRGLVPPRKRGAADERLARVLRGVQIEAETSPWDVIDALEAAGDNESADIAAILRDVAELPEGALILGERGMTPQVDDPDTLLTVMTLSGVAIPPDGLPEDQWTIPMRLAQPLLNLAIMSASRFVYAGSPNRRRALHLDEVHYLRNWGSGSGFFNRLSRDSRKRNTAVFASSQDPSDVFDLGIASLFTHAFVGRLEDDETAAAALRLVRTPVEYSEAVTMLSVETPGEFLYRDVEERVQRIRVDADWLPHLRDALNTNPDGSATGDYGG